MLRALCSFAGPTFAALSVAGPARSASVISASILNGAACTGNAAAKCFQPGDDIQAQLRFSFPDLKSFGGGFDVNFDDALASVESFNLDPMWGFDPAQPTNSFSRPLGFFTVDPHLVAVGQFTPFGGDGVIGTLDLKANALGDGSVTPAAGSDSVTQNPAGSFIDEHGGVLPVTFQGAAFSIVPEPGTLLLVAAGMAGLAAHRRV